ncbi:MAG: glucose-6-phosphate isomerase [Candidatus Omnitrophota bacterium]
MGNTLSLDTAYLKGFVSQGDLEAIFPEVEKAHGSLEKRDGPGSEYLGWMDLPEKTDEKLISDIEKAAGVLRESCDTIVIIGIGGSYLGARAAIEAISPAKAAPDILFAGYNLSPDSIGALLSKIKDRRVGINVISKSGTTTEPAIAFRIFEGFLEDKYGRGNISDRVVCTTDKVNGALRKIAEEKGYMSFVIPDDVGGRFSVLSPVGLLPFACAGIDIRQVLSGARYQRERSLSPGLDGNMSNKYAALRNILYRKGKKIEIISNFDDRLFYFSEWWKQLFGESEGKDARGIFPASCNFTTDLHSMGQLIQQGERNIMETFLLVEKEGTACRIPESERDLDKLNYLSGKDTGYVNRKAYEATAEAHFEGGVPNVTVRIPERSAFCLGQLFYFFQKAAAVSGYILGVNPFDQPGVEAYKRKMFKLLGKPGV